MMDDITSVGGPIESDEMFNDILNRMHAEGNGRLAVTMLTPSDASKIMLACLSNMMDSRKHAIYLLECNKFLKSLEEGPMVCSNHGCEHALEKHEDVGTVVIVHGMCEVPETTLVAAICSSCWMEKFKQDKDAAMVGFLKYMEELIPGMKVQTPDEAEQDIKTEQAMGGNAPSSRAVN